MDSQLNSYPDSREQRIQGTANFVSHRFHWLVFADENRPMSMRMVLGTLLAETDPVVVIETAVSVRRTGRVPRLKNRLSQIAGTEMGWHYHPLHFPEGIPGFSGLIRNANCSQLRRELRHIIPERATRIACYDSPAQFHLAGRLGEARSIYLAVDDRTRTVWGDPIPGELEAERQLLGKVDLAVCVSNFLAETLKQRMPEGRSIPVHVLPNGFDERLFDPDRKLPKPSVLAGVNGPVILIAGHMSERIDWEGIAAAARLRPGWTWLFVGPADEGLPEKIDAIGNGHVPGHRQFIWKAPVPREQMPALISHCDVCAVPYRLNRFTMASSPLKGIECLAMGAPVLSTRIPGLLRYDSVIQWVEEKNGESYALALDAAASKQRNPDAIAARRKAVSGDSNKERLRQFREIVEKEASVSFGSEDRRWP